MKPDHVKQFEQLLVKGTAQGVFPEEQQVALEQLLFEYETMSRQMGMMLPMMSQKLIDKNNQQSA
jgi:hypothetical protein